MGGYVRQGHPGEGRGEVNEARGATEHREVEGAGGRDRRGGKGVGEVVKHIRGMGLHPRKGNRATVRAEEEEKICVKKLELERGTLAANRA